MRLAVLTLFCLALLAPQSHAQVNSLDPASLLTRIENDFKKQGFQLAANTDRAALMNQIRSVYTYFNSANDPGATKRIAYLFSIFTYSNIQRISGQQIRQITTDLIQTLKSFQFSNDLVRNAKEAKALFDISQVLNLAETVTITKTPQATRIMINTNCRRASCVLTLNLNALNPGIKERMANNGLTIQRFEYGPVITLDVMSGSQMYSQAEGVKRLISERASNNVHQMNPEAPGYVENKYTQSINFTNVRGETRPMAIVNVEELIHPYADRLAQRKASITILPFLMNVSGVALVADWDKKGAGIKGFFVKSTRTINVLNVAIFPQFLDEHSAYSPIIFSGVDKLWGGINYTVKIAR